MTAESTGPVAARWVRPVNALLRPAHRFAAGRDLFPAAQRGASRRSGLPPVADPEYLADLRVLHRQLLAKPEISALGAVAAQSEVGRRLETRLRVLRLLAENPAIEAAPIDRPVFVTGLPRTATTLLHRLLAQGPAVRAPRLWELLNPAARPQERSRNLRTARWMARLYHATVPATRNIHPSNASSPEECTFLLPQTLMYEMMGPMPEYRRWYAARDLGEDYRYLRQQLQVMQHLQLDQGGRADRWILKSPFHLANLDTLLRVFPDATIVWTYRDPAVALASWCSLIEANMLMYNERVDPLVVGATWLPIWAEATRRATLIRRQLPDRFLDVTHQSLIDDPVGTTEELWKRLEIGSDASAIRRLTAEALQDGRRQPDGHRYALERYGLDPATVQDAFAPS